MRIKDGEYLDFKDVLLVPQRSALDTRADVSLERMFTFRNGTNLTCCPIIAANLDTVGTFKMARVLAKHKMLTALNKHYTEEKLFEFFSENIDLWHYVFYTLGTNSEDFDKMCRIKDRLLKVRFLEDEYFPQMVCLDAANAYTGTFEKALNRIKTCFPRSIILAGNVVTGNMTEELLLQGADIVKVGIGGGSLCTTRIKTGIGVPQLSAVDLCAYQAHGLNGHICSDGGITCVGDICKALAAGADFVMLGGFLAGTDECEGEWIYRADYELIDLFGKVDYTTVNKKYLKAYGMSSKAAMDKYSGGMASHRTSEGRELEIPAKGPVNDLLQDIRGGMASCCTYMGCLKIKDMPKCAEFIRVKKQYNDSLLYI